MAKKFKPHMMYKGKKAVKAKTMADHLRLKKQGYSHDKPKFDNGGKVPSDPPKHSLKRLEEMASAIETLKSEMREEKTKEGMAELAKLRNDYKTLKAEKFIDTSRRNRQHKASEKGDVDRAQRIFETRTLREENDNISTYNEGGKMPNVKPDNRDKLVTRYDKGGKTSRVNEAGNYTKPAMRKRLFQRIKAGTKGGKAGQWSARKAQLLAMLYKKIGGGYKN